jgi:hypothetical protein
MTFEEQSAELFRSAAERDRPAEYAAIRAYLGGLARAAADVDPTESPKTTMCPVEVKGTAAVFGYDLLANVVRPLRDGGAPLRPTPIDEAKVAYTDLVSSSASAALLAPGWETSDKVAALSAAESLGRWVIVLTSLHVVSPLVDIPERMSGQTVVEARFTPGSYQGAMFVLDRDAAKVVCGAPVSATNHVGKIESKDPSELHRAARANLAWAVQEDWHGKLSRIAPSLVPER